MNKCFSIFVTILTLRSLTGNYIVVEAFQLFTATVELLQEPIPLLSPDRPFTAPAHTVTRVGVCMFLTPRVAGRGSWAPTWCLSHTALTPRCEPTLLQSPSQIASSSMDPTGRESWDWPMPI